MNRVFRLCELHRLSDDELMDVYRTLHEHGVRGFLKYPAYLWLGWVFGVIWASDRLGPEA